MKKMSMTMGLEVVREGEQTLNCSGVSGGGLVVNKNGSSRSRAVSFTSSNDSRNSNGSKTIDLNNVARRPSDNLLSNAVLGHDPDLGGDFCPPQLGKYINDGSMKRNRPISNDSIYTGSTEVFSSPSSETVSRSSSNGEDDAIQTKQLSTQSIPPQKTRYYFNTSTPESMKNNTIRKISSQPTMPSNSVPPSRCNINTDINKQNRFTPNKIASDNYNNFKSTPLISENNITINANSSKYSLTPSQRYRLRKVNTESSLRKSVKEKESFYENQDDEDSWDVDDIDDSMIWDIPIASFSTTSFLNRKQSLKKNNNHNVTENSTKTQNNTPYMSNDHGSKKFSSNYDFLEMPTTPIQGINTKSDLKYIHDTTSSLSSLYLHSSNKLSENKLSRRAQSIDYLPMEFKENSKNGMEDLLTVSEDKLKLVSNSRPYWLPPKDSNEKMILDRQISKSLSIASIEQLERSRSNDARLKNDLLNNEKFVLLQDRGITRNSSLQSLKTLIWETALPRDMRLIIWDELLQSKEKFISHQYFESFQDLSKILKKMDFPLMKEKEIMKLVEHNISLKLPGKYPISDKLLYLLKLKAISRQGILPGDDLMFHHLLVEYFDKNPIDNRDTNPDTLLLSKIWDIVNLIQLVCFNDTVKEKYDYYIMDRYSVVGRYLANNKDFKNEYNISCLNFGTFWHILERIDHRLFLWIMDIIIVSNSQVFQNKSCSQLVTEYKGKSWENYRYKNVVSNYKILLSFTLDILLNYHYGFNDLIKLSFLEDKGFCIPMTLSDTMNEDDINALFLKKWIHYYRKF